MPRKSPRELIVNMAVSVDGRITTRARERFALGSERDRRLMDELRAKADAVIVGAGTLRHDGHPMAIRYDDLRERRRRAGRDPNPVNVVLSNTLDLPIRAGFFTAPDVHRIIFTTRRAPTARVRRFSKVAEVVILAGRSIRPGAVLAELHARNLRSVLLEGGGEIHFAFASEGLVDRLYVTITPRLIGGRDAPSLLDGKGFLKKNHPRLVLESLRRVGDEVFLRYRVKGRR